MNSLRRLPLFLFFFSLLGCPVLAGERVVYLSSGDGITVFRVEAGEGTLHAHQEVEQGGLVAISPDKTHLYALGETISSHRIRTDGSLELLGESEPAKRGSYLGIDATGRSLASSDYGAGVVRLWRIGEDRLCRGGVVQEMTLEKKIHSSVFSPDNRFLLVPATEPNCVFQLRFDEKSGLVSENDPVSAPGPADEGLARQPRHIRFHPNGRFAYTTLERELPGVGVWTWDAEKGILKVVQDIPTPPEGFSGTMTTADLHLTPDGRFLYVSNRDLTDRQASSGDSSLAAFSVDSETGRLTLLGHTPCEHVPRSFAIDEAGEFLYVAGQSSNLFGAYRIDAETGALERRQQLKTGESPSWVMCLTLP